MNKQRISLPNGNEIAYLERPGEGTPLVLLHGITDNALTYAPLLEQVDPGCHIYALDFRGHGESSKVSETYTTEAYADDVRHFIREKIGGPVLLAGHSLGGLVTVQVAVTAPELVTRILLEDPPLYFVGQMNDIYRQLFEGMVLMSRTLQDGSTPRDEWYKVMAAAPDPYSGKPGIETMGEAKINQRLDSLTMMKPQALQDGIDGSLTWDTDEVLAGIQCPVTMLTGNAKIGAVVSKEESGRVNEIVKNCTVIHFPDVGHLVHDAKPAEYLDALNKWVKG